MDPKLFNHAASPSEGIKVGRQRRELERTDYVRMRLSRSFWEVRARGIQDERARAVCIAYAQNVVQMVESGSGLLVIGGHGIGKSSVTAVIAKEARRWGLTALFVRADEFRDYSFSQSDFADSVSMGERIRDVDLLVIDDFDQELVEDRSEIPKQLARVVETRNKNLRATMITSNIPSDVFQKRMPKLYRAIFERSVIVPMAGVDRSQDSHRDTADRMNRAMLSEKDKNGSR